MNFPKKKIKLLLNVICNKVGKNNSTNSWSHDSFLWWSVCARVDAAEDEGNPANSLLLLGCCVDGAYSSIIMIGAHTACVCNRVNENTKSVCIISAPFDIHLPIRWCMQKMQMSCSRRLVACYHFAESLITGAAMRRRRAGLKWVRAAGDAAALGMGRCSVWALSTRARRETHLLMALSLLSQFTISFAPHFRAGIFAGTYFSRFFAWGAGFVCCPMRFLGVHALEKIDLSELEQMSYFCFSHSYHE